MGALYIENSFLENNFIICSGYIIMIERSMYTLHVTCIFIRTKYFNIMYIICKYFNIMRIMYIIRSKYFKFFMQPKKTLFRIYSEIVIVPSKPPSLSSF